MPEPRAMNIAVFMDEVMAINGPLMLIPKSHKHGTLAAEHDVTTASYPLWTLDKETVTRLAQEGGIVAPTGEPGSVLMFHGNLVHGSAPNITPYPRRIVYLTLCAVSNYIRTPTRPEWIAHRDFTPIEPVADDALLNYARSYYKEACGHPGIEVVVEATGSPAAGIAHARAAVAAGKHIVMVNVEADVLAGPLLAEEARGRGVVYSMAYGDQPALTCELVDWARACGFEVVAAG